MLSKDFGYLDTFVLNFVLTSVNKAAKSSWFWITVIHCLFQHTMRCLIRKNLAVDTCIYCAPIFTSSIGLHEQRFCPINALFFLHHPVTKYFFRVGIPTNRTTKLAKFNYIRGATFYICTLHIFGYPGCQKFFFFARGARKGKRGKNPSGTQGNIWVAFFSEHPWLYWLDWLGIFFLLASCWNLTFSAAKSPARGERNSLGRSEKNEF